MPPRRRNPPAPRETAAVRSAKRTCRKAKRIMQWYGDNDVGRKHLIGHVAGITCDNRINQQEWAWCEAIKRKIDARGKRTVKNMIKDVPKGWHYKPWGAGKLTKIDAYRILYPGRVIND